MGIFGKLKSIKYIFVFTSDEMFYFINQQSKEIEEIKFI